MSIPATLPGADSPSRTGRLALALLILLAPLAMALSAPVNHDEDQYLGAALFVREWVPYRDFASLQPPLHAWVLAPVIALFPGWGFLAARIATALIASLMLALFHRIAIRAGARWRAATIATLLFVCTTIFHIGASLARNDILPVLLLVLGIGAAIGDRRRPAAIWPLLAGLCLGLAVSSKISYAPPAAALALWFLIAAESRPQWRARWIAAALAGIGTLIGLLPLILSALTAPEALFWGLVRFGIAGPHDYYTQWGQGYWLTPPGKLQRLFRVMAEGSSLPVLILWLVIRLRAVVRGNGARQWSDIERLTDLMILAGLAATWGPTPSWRQYALPLLPPLYLWFALRITASPIRVRAAVIVLALFAVAGLARPARDVAAAVQDGSPVLRSEARAQTIAAILTDQHVTGVLTTPYIHAAMDSGHPLDPRLATGVFVLRNHGLISPAKAAQYRVLTYETLFAQLDSAPPPAILTNIEKPSEMFPQLPDSELRRYAVLRGYRLHPLPGGVGELWIYPKAAISR